MIKVSIEDVYPLAVEIAEARHNQKKNYKTHKPLSDNYEVVGVLGELVFSLIIQQHMDIELKKEGDDGFDFAKSNIKTSEEHKARHLIEFKDKQFFGYYYFVIVNLQNKYGFVRGYIHSKEFREKAQLIDFGYGERLALELTHLHEWTPKKPLVLNNIYNHD
jgi:hypothetical protein